MHIQSLLYKYMHTVAGLENSTRPRVFTSASGCRASENFDISSDFFSPYMPVVFVMQGKIRAYFQIFQGLSYNMGIREIICIQGLQPGKALSSLLSYLDKLGY